MCFMYSKTVNISMLFSDLYQDKQLNSMLVTYTVDCQCRIPVKVRLLPENVGRGPCGVILQVLVTIPRERQLCKNCKSHKLCKKQNDVEKH
ncbi:hypothetical protein FKM82_025985 [Ascaphus truei]